MKLSESPLSPVQKNYSAMKKYIRHNKTTI